MQRAILTSTAAILGLALTLCSCALQKKKANTESGASTIPAASPPPSPTPQPEPTPEPTPQSTYRITVSTEDGQQQETVIAPGQEATPAPAARNEVTVHLPAEATPTPAPTPKGNIFTSTLRKIFPPKPKPPEGTEPIKIKPRGENFIARLWHKIFPAKKRPPVAETPLWVGTVKLVNERDHYVLIDTQGFVVPPSGQVIHTIGSDTETSSLRISADRTPPFFIADILSGKPNVGDRVYSPNP